MIQAIRVVDQFRRGLAFDAHDAAVGMIVVGIEPSDAAVLDRGDGGAVRGAEGAVAADRVEGLPGACHFKQKYAKPFLLSRSHRAGLTSKAVVG